MGGLTMKKASLGGTVAVACLVSTLTFAGVAHADAQSCTRVGAGAVCNTTKGSGAYVREIWAIRDKPLSTSIMNPSADASVLDGRNNAHVKWFQHKSRTGSDVGRSWLIFYPQRTFACGDLTSVRFYENNVPQGGYANVRLC
jgi:hypothetical protein